MLEHDAIYHYGIPGMRWGRRKSYQEKQARDKATISGDRAKIKDLRARGKRYQAQMLEYKRTNSLEKKTIARENINDFNKLYKGPRNKNPLLSKSGRIEGMKANKKYYDKMAKADRANSKRSLARKDANFWDKINAKAADSRAGRAEFESRMMNRRIQKKLKQPVDKISPEDRKRIINDVVVAAALTTAYLVTVSKLNK